MRTSLPSAPSIHIHRFLKKYDSPQRSEIIRTPGHSLDRYLTLPPPVRLCRCWPRRDNDCQRTWRVLLRLERPSPIPSVPVRTALRLGGKPCTAGPESRCWCPLPPCLRHIYFFWGGGVENVTSPSPKCWDVLPQPLHWFVRVGKDSVKQAS